MSCFWVSFISEGVPQWANACSIVKSCGLNPPHVFPCVSRLENQIKPLSFLIRGCPTGTIS